MTEKYVGYYAGVNEVLNTVNLLNGNTKTKFTFSNGYVRKETVSTWRKEPMSHAERLHENDRIRYIEQEAGGSMPMIRKLVLKRTALSGPDKIRRFATVLYENGYSALAKEVLGMA